MEINLQQTCNTSLKRSFDKVEGTEYGSEQGHEVIRKKETKREESSDEVTRVKAKNPVENNLPEFNFIKYCYRHNPDVQRSCQKTMVTQDQIRAKKWFKKVDSLENTKEKQLIRESISSFQNSNDKIRRLILEGIIQTCCFPQLSYVAHEVKELIKIDFISTLPEEISLKVLGYLDCQSLCNAALVCKRWKCLADNDRVWYHMCEQHIDRKCPNCGWGLPLLHMKRARYLPVSEVTVKNGRGTPNVVLSRQVEKAEGTNKCQKADSAQVNVRTNCQSQAVYYTRPWKVIYRERFQVESNWRNGRYRLQTFKGHMDGVLSLKYNHRLMFTGSYDSTVAIWDTKSGNLIRRLSGHTDGVKAIFFDDQKLITGSLDKTIRVWNYITGSCISTYRGHQDSVLSVDSYKKIIVSASADKTVKVWHVESRTCYTLRGHTEWVNCVKLHPRSFTCYSCSDDKTIRMWDIRTNSCLKVFKGHVGQVQKVIPLTIVDPENLVVDVKVEELPMNSNEDQDGAEEECLGSLDPNLKYPSHLLSCSLDNTIKLWEVASGKCIRTQFGHVEGVWDIAADNFRIISGSHDKNIKVWDLQNGKCIQTFAGHKAPIVCVGIGDSSFASGDEVGEVKMWHFDDIDQ